MVTRNDYGISARKPLRKRLLGTPRWRCGDNINMNLREVSCEDKRWMELA
jgi:hypothetical protein